MTRAIAIAAAVDPYETSALDRGDQSREKMIVSRAPNRWRSNRNRGESLAVRGKDDSFALGFRAGIGAERPNRDRPTLVRVDDRIAVGNDCGCADRHEAADARVTRCVDQYSSAIDVHSREFVIATVEFEKARRVEHGLMTGQRIAKERLIQQVSDDRLGPCAANDVLELPGDSQRTDAVAPLHQRPREVPANKS